MIEEYHQISKLPNYTISNMGNIRNSKGVILSPFLTKNGYKKINILRQGYYIHRLVAESFIPNPENKPQVNHIDGNKKNNCADNLEWVTNSENMKDAFRRNKKRSSHAIVIVEKYSGRKFPSIIAAAKHFGLNPSTIAKSIKEGRGMDCGKKFIRS